MPKNAASQEGVPARIAAYDVLDHVLGRKQTLDSALDRVQTFRDLTGIDRAFCRMLVSTTLRRLGQIDHAIDAALHEPGSDVFALRMVLRVGAAQILFMEVPDHAAVDTSVNLAAVKRWDRKKSLINGVLRTIIRQKDEVLAAQDETRINTPDWLLKLWIADYGLHTAAQISKAHLCEAPLDLTFQSEQARDDFAVHEPDKNPQKIGPMSLRLEHSGAVTDMQGFDAGQWWVQDVAASLPAYLFGDLRGKTVIDMCAAPGGKTMQLAAQGADVIALDRSATRMQRVKDNLKRTGLTDQVQIHIIDACTWAPKTAPHAILLDAPCSATGTIRRHPDLPHLKSQRDIESLTQVQERMLNHAFTMLAPGGTLVYCVCSLQKCEGEAQIARLLSTHQNASKIAITAREIGGLKECITDTGDVRALPFYLGDQGGMDGFFISRLTKL